MTRTIWPLAIVICTFAIANVIGDDSLIEPRSKLNQTGHNPDQPLPDTGTKPARYAIQTNFKANWFMANNFCRRFGLHLASVNSIEDQLELEREIKLNDLEKETFWLSGNDLSTTGKFYWSNGLPFVYKNWQKDAPNNEHGIEHCVQVNFDFTWNDKDCRTTHFFICE